jgi:hypothetical protein
MPRVLASRIVLYEEKQQIITWYFKHNKLNHENPIGNPDFLKWLASKYKNNELDSAKATREMKHH